MNMTLTISIVAILISLATLTFNLYQFKNTKKLEKLEKCNEVLQQAFLLRKASQELRNKINVTDDIDDLDYLLIPMNLTIETQFGKMLENVDISIHEVFMIEKKLIQLDLQLTLLSKAVDVKIDFNNQVKHFEKDC
ncbi:MAG: hypothetical protein ACYCSS_04610 [Sulfuriferula sp.]